MTFFPLGSLHRWFRFLAPVPATRDAAVGGGADGGGDGPRGVGSPRQLLRPDSVPRPAGGGADRLIAATSGSLSLSRATDDVVQLLKMVETFHTSDRWDRSYRAFPQLMIYIFQGRYIDR